MTAGKATMWLALVSVVMLSLFACQSYPRAKQPPLVDTGKPALHAIEGEKLHDLMGELNRLMFERLPQELDLSHERHKFTKQVAGLATEMEEASKYIPSALEQLQLEDDEQKLFLTLANRLEVESRILRDNAEQNDFHGVDESIDRMVATCNACHSAFRQF